MDHILSELSYLICPCWVALHCMAHSFIELDKALVHVIRLVSFVCLWVSFSALWWRGIRGLWKLPVGRDWLRGNLGLVLMGGAMLSKSLIQFSAEGWGCVPSLLFDLGPNYPRGNEDNGTSFKRSLACTAAISAPNTAVGHHWPMPPLETPGGSWASLGHLQSVVCCIFRIHI